MRSWKSLHWTLCLLIACLMALSRAQENSTDATSFDFSCKRSANLCNGGTCNVDTQACLCPTDKTYNYECVASDAAGYCESPQLYGPTCEIPRVEVYCVVGKMFVNVLVHGGNDKFSGLMFVNGKEAVEACKFKVGATADYAAKDGEYGFLDAANMQGYYLELDNTDANCGAVTSTEVPTSGGEPAYTLHSRQFRIQYNQMFQASLDQLLTASCKQVDDAEKTTVSFGTGEVTNADDNSDLDQVKVQNDVGIVSLELLDKDFKPLTPAIALGSQIILKFVLAAGNEYTDLRISGCKVNNSLPADDADYRTFDLFDDKGCPAPSAAGVFKNFPTKQTVGAGEPQVILMSVGAFRFTGKSNKVGFQCEISLCKAGTESTCQKADCSGYVSEDLTTPVEPTVPETPTTGELAATLTSDKINPLGLAEPVTLTCTATGGTGPYTYAIRDETDTTAATYTATNTLTLPTGVVGTKKYVCLAKDAGTLSATSLPVELQYVDVFTVGIAQDPVGDAKINTNVEITCKSAGGTGPVTLTLLENDVDIGSTFPFVATSATVATKTYKCKGTDTGNANAVVESSVLTLKFVDLPEVVLTSEQTNPVPANTDAVVKYTATGGTAPYTAEWSVNDVVDETVEANATELTVPFQAGATVKVTVKVTDAASSEVTKDYSVVFAGTQAPTTPTLAVTFTSNLKNPLSLDEAVTLTCEGQGGTGPYTYYIRDQANPGTPSFAAANTVAAPQSGAGTTTYLCDVKDSSGATVASSALPITRVDTLTAQAYAEPAGPVAVNTQVTLTCKAAGSANALTYSWTKDDAPAAVSTAATFTDTSATAATVKYTCTVTDATATATKTAEVSVEFTALPATPTLAVTFTPSVKNPLNANTEVKLTCEGQGGTGPYTYFIREQGSTDAATFESANTLDALPTTPGTKNYLCDVKDSAGATVTSAALPVIVVDTLTAQAYAEPAGPVAANTQVTLTCKAAGSANALTYSWTKDDAPAAVSTAATFTDTSATAATVKYTCTVTDATATATTIAEVSVEFTAAPARKRRSAQLLRYRRATPDSGSVSGEISVFDPQAAGSGEQQVEKVKEPDCVDDSDMNVVVIILAVAVVLLLLMSAVLGAMLLRSRQKVVDNNYRGRRFEAPVQTMAMPRLEFSSSAGSNIAQHGV